MKKTLFAMLAGASLLLAGAAHAGATGFEELSTAGDFASLAEVNPYAGLVWGDDWYAGDTSIDGYANGAHSGDKFAVNGFGADHASVGSATAFDFAGAWFATADGAADKASWIDIQAYDASNQLIGDTGHVAIGGTYVWVDARFAKVSRLSISRDTGWYVMDDFSTGAVSAVPEPGAPLMLGLGLGVLGLARRLRRAQR